MEMAYYTTVFHIFGFRILRKKCGNYYYKLGNGKIRRLKS